MSTWGLSSRSLVCVVVSLISRRDSISLFWVEPSHAIYSQVLLGCVGYFLFLELLPSRYFWNLNRWWLMLFLLLGGGLGPSMQPRRACSTAAHAEEACPAEAQHAVIAGVSKMFPI